MKKTTVTFGRSRPSTVRQNSDCIADTKTEEKRGALCGGLFALGIVMICACLIIPMSGKSVPEKEDFVSVMSGAVDERSNENADGDGREILAAPDIDTSAEESEFSIFKYIGNAIADLLTGEK